MSDVLDPETRRVARPDGPSGPVAAEAPAPPPVTAVGGPGDPTVPAPVASSAAPKVPLHRLVWRAITPLGRSVLAASIVLGLVARSTGWAELAILSVAGFAGVAIGVAFLLAGQADLAVDLRLGVRRVVVGDPATTQVATTNQSSRRILPIRLETRVGKGAARVNVPGLAAGASHDEIFMIPTSRRSVVPVGPVRSVQGDPLGLVRREVRWTGTEELFVHPRTVRTGPLTTGWQRDLEGETTNDRSPSDVAFHTLREYVVGDDRRHIHWRTTARQTDGKLMVREFVDTRRAHVGVVLPVAERLWQGRDDFELGVSIAASLGVRALSDEQEVTCLVGTRSVPAHQGPGFLDSMARIELGDDDADLLTLARRGRDLLAGASVVVVLAGARADVTEVRRAADVLGHRAATLVLIVDPSRSSGRRPGSSGAVFDIGSLAELPRVVAGGLGR